MMVYIYDHDRYTMNKTNDKLRSAQLHEPHALYEPDPLRKPLLEPHAWHAPGSDEKRLPEQL